MLRTGHSTNKMIIDYGSVGYFTMAKIIGYNLRSVVADIIDDEGKYLHILEGLVSALYIFDCEEDFTIGGSIRFFECHERILDDCVLYQKELDESFYLLVDNKRIPINKVYVDDLPMKILFLNAKIKKLEHQNNELKLDNELYKSTKEFIEQAKTLS